MFQQVITAPRVIEFREVQIRKPKDNEVLVKVKRVGICGSDIHLYHGNHPYTGYPVTQGHEVAGKVVEVGGKVRDINVGQKITIEPQFFCGKCYPCKHNNYNLCEELQVMGFNAIGAASEFFTVDAANVTPLPESISFDEGAVIEPVAVAVHAVKQVYDISGMNIAVIGAGPIGNLVAQVAKGMGASKVLITDVGDYRLALAEKCGIDVCVNTRQKDYGEILTESFGSDKADVIYDCAGNNMTMEHAIKYSRKGSIIVLVAVFASMAKIDLAMLNNKELDLKTSMMYRHDDFVDAIRLVKEKKIKLKPIISNHFMFKDYKKAYDFIDANYEKSMKVIIDIDE